MQTVEAMKRKIESAKDLESVVKTMKSIAAVNIRFYEKATESLREYNKAIDFGFQIALKTDYGSRLLQPAGTSKNAAVIVIGSAQGMCGQFNDKIADYAESHISEIKNEAEKITILVLGEKLEDKMRRAGIEISDTMTLPGSLDGIKFVVDDLIIRLEKWRVEEAIDKIVIFYNHYESGANYSPGMRHLMPFDREWLKNLFEKEWEGPTLPAFSVGPKTLVSALIRNYFFASLHSAVTESLTGENASRLSSMQAAENNIKDHLDELNKEFNQKRQSAITSELLDIISGYEVLVGS